MLRQRLVPIIAVGVILCVFAQNVSAKTIVVNTCLSRGHLIVRPLTPGVSVRRVVRVPVIATRHHHGKMTRRPLFHRIGPVHPHRHGVIGDRRPHVRHFRAFPGSKLHFRSGTGAVERMIITVWITNSNGSRTAVELIKRGPGFIGPRGEWYKHIPTVAQLRIAYGF